MTEAQIQSKIIKYLESKGAYTIKVISGNKKGIPDIIACYRGLFLGIEVKQPSTKSNVSPLQKHNLELITKAGGYSSVMWDVDMTKQLLEVIDEAFSTSN